ncbi:helix-turn-helix transcriptional regulator [Streptomyces sp. Q6]|uniref:Helix-turn-helix transcriptional regulator n=1 Tax=Streptomyces citrinus TaxID=3118173 RepID=A0ACD5A917_9ACTN
MADARESLLLATRLCPPDLALPARLAAAEASWALGDMDAYREAAAPALVRTPETPEPDADRDYRLGMSASLGDRYRPARVALRRVVARAAQERDPDALLRAGAAALVAGDVDAACRTGSRALAAARVQHAEAELLAPWSCWRTANCARGGTRGPAPTPRRAARRARHRPAQRPRPPARDPGPRRLPRQRRGGRRPPRRGRAGHRRPARPRPGRHPRPVGAGPRRPGARPGRGGGGPARAARPARDPVRALRDPDARRAVLRRGGGARGRDAGRGEGSGAHAAVAEFVVWAERGHDAQAPAQLARCQALLSTHDPAVAPARFVEALARHERTGGDFERARTAALYGKWLRRARRPARARVLLRDALVAFERCGATVWAEQTAAELRATGEAPAHREPPGMLSELTPQQLRIARCVADGATNREVAQHLSVSPRTVDHHLRNVFAQLGVRSRVELARLVDRAEQMAAHS